MPTSSTLVTAAEISRLAGVTRATVSNWRRRHEDFPAPTGGSDSSPLYEVKAVREWLAGRGYTAETDPAEELRNLLRQGPSGGATASRLIPFVLAAVEAGAEQRATWSGLPDAALAEQASAAVSTTLAAVEAPEPDAGPDVYGPDAAELLRAVTACVDSELTSGGTGASTLDALAQRELTDSKATGSYATPAPLPELMAALLAAVSDATAPTRVLDPACGSGSLLAAAATAGATELYGQDIAPVQARRAAVQLRIAAAGAHTSVRAGDSLRADAYPGLTVDGVLCAPPYGDRDWGHDELAYDSRWAFGVPSRMDSELAWVQHALAHVRPGGGAVLLMPPSPAFSGSGRRVRAELVRTGALRAVVELPGGLTTFTSVRLQLWVLQRPSPQPPEAQSVLFVDAQAAVMRAPEPTEPPKAVLTHWDAYAKAPDRFEAVPGVARAVPFVDLLDERVDLTPSRHVNSGTVVVPSEAAATATGLRNRLADAAQRLTASLTALGEPAPAGEEVRAWRTATVADLSRGGALATYTSAPFKQRTSRGLASTSTGAHVTAGSGKTAHFTNLMLKARDVATGARASEPAPDENLETAVRVSAGDILIPLVVQDRTGSGPVPFRVADEEDEGNLLGPHLRLFRPDPARLDPWFLGGFLSAGGNVRAAAVGSTTLRIDANQLRVPLLPLAEQRRYGKVFRHLYELRIAGTRAAELASQASDFMSGALATGALLPPEGPASP
ncbi:N-6 DNA methylase [Streptomyces sp. Q6]|uniref:N-6 DNA methylase n=1 Tax=Streptomyces citrinus TaxID=3118173 RepID=A0ACD5AKF2_9ACTN